MLISNNFNHFNNYNKAVATRPTPTFVKQLSCDTVSFTSSKNGNSLEEKMKTISGLHDPYSEIIMVSDSEFDKYMSKVEKRPTAQSVLNLLNGYKDNLFAPEKEACDILADELNNYKQNDIKSANKIDLHELLNRCYPNAKASLSTNQLAVLNNIKSVISETNGETNEKLTRIFEPVEKSIVDDSFRINPLLQEVRATKGIDKAAKKRVLQGMDKFPNSRNSAAVFIVTNAPRSHEEIAEAFITPSRVSIEHIRPQSCGGKSSLSNYLLASKRMNSIRSSLPLDRFIKRNPNVPNCIEKYFNDLIKKINNGGLSYVAISLPEVAETLKHESKGLVEYEIVELAPEEVEKTNLLKAQLDALIQKFSK